MLIVSVSVSARSLSVSVDAEVWLKCIPDSSHLLLSVCLEGFGCGVFNLLVSIGLETLACEFEILEWIANQSSDLPSLFVSVLVELVAAKLDAKIEWEMGELSPLVCSTMCTTVAAVVVREGCLLCEGVSEALDEGGGRTIGRDAFRKCHAEHNKRLCVTGGVCMAAPTVSVFC